ncbi:MAG: HAMP domain-containing sensor histidine kinase [Pseudomonadota bacterium]
MARSESHLLRTVIERVPLTVDGGRDNELSWRIVTSTNFVRLGVAIVLLGFFTGATDPRVVGERLPLVFSVAVIGYLSYAVLSVLLIRARAVSLETQVLLQLAIDIAVIITLMHASGGIRSGIGGLLVIFVGAAALAQRSQTPYFVPAVATLLLLAEQFASQVAGATDASDYTATGILGAILFAIPLFVGPLARRLSESEELARQRGDDLARLSELNRYIVQHLRESIVAVDGDDRVRLLNDSAASLLGTTQASAGEELASLSPRLAAEVRAWREADPDVPRPALAMDGPEGSRIDINIVPLASKDGGAPPILIFMEDTTILAERVQQSKLASLGRLSASIAHEIRNPVGAMSHAGQLLSETGGWSPSERRLIDIIISHSERVSDIIDNILQLSRRETSQREVFGLAEWLAGFAREFAQTLELNEGEIAILRSDPALRVLIDKSHLRQVLWNLCDNAVKYASDGGAVLVELRMGRVEGTGRPYLDVTDHGSGIEPELVSNIFEPFFTAQRGGTGLGLYISRELCELNGAALSYRPGDDGGSVFRIVFADPARWARGSSDT